MTAIQFDMTPADTWATVYNAEGRPVATLRRPVATRPAQRAVPLGDHWTLHGLDGALLMARRLRPTRAAMIRAIDARAAEIAAEEAAAEEAAAEEAAAAPRPVRLNSRGPDGRNPRPVEKFSGLPRETARAALRRVAGMLDGARLDPELTPVFAMTAPAYEAACRTTEAIDSAEWMAPNYEDSGLFA